MRKKESPRLSIVTVVFNNSENLKLTLKSVSSQSFRDFEHIIIDGGSTDGTLELVKSFQEHPILWISEKDSGIYEAMNKGIRLSNGEYLNFLNAGDIYFDSEVVASIFNPPCTEDMIYGDYIMEWKERGEKEQINSLKFSQENLKKYGTRTLNHQALFVKKAVVPFYDEKFKISELNWHFDLAERVKVIRYIDKPLVISASGGKTHNNFWLWLYEMVNTIQHRAGIKQSVKNIPYYFYLVLNNKFGLLSSENKKRLKKLIKNNFR